MANGTTPTGATVTGTTAISMSTAGSGAILTWIFQCVEAGHLLTPDQTVTFILAAAIAPILHGILKGFARWFEKKTGVDIDGDGKVANGHPPVLPAPAPEAPHA